MPTSKQDKILKRAIKRSDIYSVITQLAAFGQLNKKYKTKSKKLIRKTAKFGASFVLKGLKTASKATALAGVPKVAQVAPALAGAAKGAALAQVAPALAGVVKSVAATKSAPALAGVVKSALAATKGAPTTKPSKKEEDEKKKAAKLPAERTTAPAVRTTTTTTTPTAATPVTPVTPAPGAKPVGFGKKKAVRKSKGKGKSGRRGGRV